MKKRTLLLICLACIFIHIKTASAQYSGSFYVQGDLGKYYPVTITDASWSNNKATEFEIGRSDVHADATWRGSVIARFRIHATRWGNSSNFIDANIRQFNFANQNCFIAGWRDATAENANMVIVIWLQGGGTTYYYNSPVNINPVVYDGVQNALPYQETNGPAHTYKTSIDNYVNSNGEISSGSAYYVGGNNNYFASKVGIGTTTPDELLSVKGVIHSQEVKIDMTGWSDYVLKPAYKLPSLSTVKTYIEQNGYLPEVPSEDEMVKNGLQVGEMNKLLMKKVEELTLYLIEQQKQIDQLKIQVVHKKTKIKKH